MRSRLWFWATLVLIAALVAVGAAALVSADRSDRTDELQPGPEPTTTAPAVSGVFQLRQVLFQETGRIQLKPPLRPGPAKGGNNATRDLLRVDCDLKARPMGNDDNVVLCDVNGFRYGLGPSAVPDDPVASAAAQPDPYGAWFVSVQLDDDATDDFTALTRDLYRLRPPLNQAAIVINGTVVTAPVVNEKIMTGQLHITGEFTREEADALAASLGG